MNTQLKVELITPTFLLQRLAVHMLKYSVFTDTLILYLVQQYILHYILIFIISDTRQKVKRFWTEGTKHPKNLICVWVCVMKIKIIGKYTNLFIQNLKLTAGI
jgi:hypothetical protein